MIILNSRTSISDIPETKGQFNGMTEVYEILHGGFGMTKVGIETSEGLTVMVTE